MNEVQDALGRNYGVSDEIDEADLDAELAALEDDLEGLGEEEGRPLPTPLPIHLPTHPTTQPTHPPTQSMQRQASLPRRRALLPTSFPLNLPMCPRQRLGPRPPPMNLACR